MYFTRHYKFVFTFKNQTQIYILAPTVTIDNLRVTLMYLINCKLRNSKCAIPSLDTDYNTHPNRRENLYPLFRNMCSYEYVVAIHNISPTSFICVSFFSATLLLISFCCKK